MQFATIFLIASAVLAMPTGSSGSNAVAGLVKRADGSFVFPDDNERVVYTPNKGTKVPTKGRIIYPDEFESDYTPKKQDTRIHFPDEDNQAQKGQDQAQKGQDQAQKGQDQNAQASDDKKYKPHPFNNAKDSNNIPCSVYKDLEDLNAIPVECYRPIFCDVRVSKFRQACSIKKITSDVLVKEEVLKRTKTTLCMVDAVCRSQDLNHLPSDA